LRTACRNNSKDHNESKGGIHSKEVIKYSASVDEIDEYLLIDNRG